MTEKQLEANRRNALKSSGPTTRCGKVVSSRNAVKHGVLSEAPVLVGIESAKLWKKHRDGMLETIRPVGYVENLLTIRLATQTWRMSRVVRFESEVSTDAVARAETDLEDRDDSGSGKPEGLETASREAHIWSLVIETLEALPKLRDEESLDSVAAVNTMWALWGGIKP